MSVNNFGPDDLSLRLLFMDAPTPTNLAFSSTAVVVPAGSGWQSVTFPVTAGDLTASVGSAAGALAAASEMRLFHNPDAAFPPPTTGPPAVTATLGVDNVRAVPEPTMSAGVVLLTLAATLARRGR